MKMNIKKVATVLGSALMLGATAGMAAAASYSAPFVSNGAANVAIVVGSNAALSDGLAATAIASDLASDLAAQTATGSASSGSTVSGGDSVKIEGSSDKFNLGDSALTTLVTSINSDKMPNLLADGVYTDDDNTEYEYTQKIALGNNLNLSFFSDSDYKDNAPTIGMTVPSDKEVLNYTLDFSNKNPLFNSSSLETTTISLMGKQYYVLNVQNTSATDRTLTLLDSANSVIVSEGESSTVEVAGKPYEVSISFIDSTKAKLVVNGQTTNSLSSGATYKLSDGTYVGVKDIMYSSKDSGVSKVELSIGKGKLEIQQATDIQLNDDTVNGVKGYLPVDSEGKLSGITLQWNTDERAFVAPDSSMVLPGFESVKISMADFFAPNKEVTKLQNNGNKVLELNTTIKGGPITIPLIGLNTDNGFATIGEDSTSKLAVATTTMTFNQTAGDKYIVATWNSSKEAESRYLKVEVIQESGVNKTRFTDEISGDSKTVTAGNDVTYGNIVITADNINKTGDTKWVTLTGKSNTVFNTLYTKAGMKINLPVMNGTTYFNKLSNTQYADDTAACALISLIATEVYAPFSVQYNKTSTGATNASCLQVSGQVVFSEQDKDLNLGKNNFNFTASLNSDDKMQVSSVNGAGSGYEIGSSNDYQYYIPSSLATGILHKTGGDQDSVEITYAGGESYADAYISAPSATVSAGSTGSGATATSLGQITVKDTEASSVSGKNLIVIGGSCINSVAADLLGGAACDAAFTAKTGVKAGEALIKSFDRSGKVALLVAGFNAADTEKAATYLVNKGANTTVGAALKVTSATEATAITA